MNNRIRTTLLLAALTVFLVWMGNIIGGRQGMLIALVLAAGMNFFSYWYSDKIVLKMYRAQPISPQQAPKLYQMVQDLAQQAELPMPKVVLIPKDAPNAFATGRNPENAVVAVTQGLLKIMEPEEVKGVLAHELGHVKNRDILIGSIAATLAGAVMMLASMARFAAIFGGGQSSENRGGGLGLFLMAILAPIGAAVIQMAISRSREYQADASGAKFAGHPEGLARALEKLGAYSGRVPMDASPSTAHMFIVNPLSGGGMANLFSTHPPLQERIARLRQMGGGHYQPPRPSAALEPDDNAGSSMWDRLR